jgi:predicted nuclease with TOPRIM domain
MKDNTAREEVAALRKEIASLRSYAESLSGRVSNLEKRLRELEAVVTAQNAPHSIAELASYVERLQKEKS